MDSPAGAQTAATGKSFRVPWCQSLHWAGGDVHPLLNVVRRPAHLLRLLKAIFANSCRKDTNLRLVQVGTGAALFVLSGRCELLCPYRLRPLALIPIAARMINPVVRSR